MVQYSIHPAYFETHKSTVRHAVLVRYHWKYCYLGRIFCFVFPTDQLSSLEHMECARDRRHQFNIVDPITGNK